MMHFCFCTMVWFYLFIHLFQCRFALKELWNNCPTRSPANTSALDQRAARLELLSVDKAVLFLTEKYAQLMVQIYRYIQYLCTCWRLHTNCASVLVFNTEENRAGREVQEQRGSYARLLVSIIILNHVQ